MALLKIEDVTKVYEGKVTHRALNQFSFEVEKGEFLAIMGPSGSGKTTLLNLISTIDRPTSGVIELDGVNPHDLNKTELAYFRRKELGFIFQDFNLLPMLNVEENMVLPLTLDGMNVEEMQRRIDVLAQELDLTKILEKRPNEISGGQAQKTAIGRALIHRPTLILADEPTGNLDSKSTKDVLELLGRINQRENATIVMVTHDPIAASYCDRVLFIKDGEFFNEIYKDNQRQTFFQGILNVLSLLGGMLVTLRQFAFRNVIRNSRVYAAFFMASISSVMVFFIYSMLMYHPRVENEFVTEIAFRGMFIAEIILVLFMLFFLFYSVRAFLEARSKEFGILMQLGMEKNS